MTDEELQGIRGRYAQGESTLDDLPALLAEVDRLRAYNKRLTADLENARNASDFWTWLHTGETQETTP